jgi:hypothetical protein
MDHESADPASGGDPPRRRMTQDDLAIAYSQRARRASAMPIA